LVEQGIENPRVGGSIPSPATTNFKGLQQCKPFLFFTFTRWRPFGTPFSWKSRHEIF
jgi:hypothetical protein